VFLDQRSITKDQQNHFEIGRKIASTGKGEINANLGSRKNHRRSEGPT